MSYDVKVTFRQDVWWATADGLIRLIDDLDDRHRANIAALLVKNAASYHARIRLYQMEADWMSYEQAGWDAFWRGSWGPVTDEPPTREKMLHDIRKEQDRGQHLDWIRGTVLFKRMIRDLPESTLPPGTLRSATEAAQSDFAS